jgi:hypothetical protein
MTVSEQLQALYDDIEAQHGKEPGIWGRLAARACISRNKTEEKLRAVRRLCEDFGIEHDDGDVLVSEILKAIHD